MECAITATQTFFHTSNRIDLVIACAIVGNEPDAVRECIDQFWVEASSQLAAFVSLYGGRIAGAAACSGLTHLDAIKCPCNRLDTIVDSRPAVVEKAVSVAIVELLQRSLRSAVKH